MRRCIPGLRTSGALGYLAKAAARADIERAVKAAAAGQAILDPTVQRRLIAAATGAPDDLPRRTT
ncbi:hypothetical protein ABZ746_30930 [Streptomyces sp. NPDC020096]